MEDLVFDQIETHLDELLRYSRDYEVDPALVIAILYAEKVQYELDKLRRAKEKMVESLAFARMLRNSLVQWAALSAGFAHIKPEFARRTKELADQRPELRNALSSQEVAPEGYLDSPATAIKITCVALALLQRQWRDHPNGLDLSDRPAILATLFNLGYEKSRPHRAPRSGGSVMPVVINGVHLNGMCFGDRVQRLCEDSVRLRAMTGYAGTTANSR